MERQRFRELRGLLREASVGHENALDCSHQDVTIVQVLLWATLHQRSVNWACQLMNWPGDLLPRPLPSQSCMSRRQRTYSVLQLIERFEQVMRNRLPRCTVKLIDARPLVVGGCSKDPDAAKGYGAGQKSRGYKLHMVCDLSGAVDHWLVAPMNQRESVVAPLLLEHVRDAQYVLGDGGFDANHLYDQAGEQQTQWIASPWRSGAKGMGHHAHSPWRKKVWKWVRSKEGTHLMQKHRSGIERVNAWQGQAEVGLSHLPHHVRRQHRVQVWVALKLIIYHHWLYQNIQAQKSA